MIAKKFFGHYFTWGVFILLALLAVAAAGSWPQLFGHTANEIEPIVLEKSTSCSGTSCHLDCDPGYAVFSGACTTSGNDGRWNLFGANSNHKGWDCVDGTATPATTITIDITCVKTSFDSTDNPFCGNYVVELPEVCDGPNIKDIDCTDYSTTLGAQLCNGTIGTCSVGCSGLDVSQCEYCDPGSCAYPNILCNDGWCRLNCSAHGGATGSGILVSSSGSVYYPPSSPLPPPPTGPGTPFCPNGIVEAGEECDTGGDTSVGVPSCPGACMECPIGSGMFVMFNGTCSDTCACVAPTCGGAPGPLACSGPGVDPSNGLDPSGIGT